MKEEKRKQIHDLAEEQKKGKWKGMERNLLKELWNTLRGKEK